MHRSSPRTMARRSFGCLLICVSAVFAVSGCGHEKTANVTSVTTPPTVRVVRPQTRNIIRTVGQPSFVESYERTSIFPKVTGYIEKWYVDIGDKVTKQQVLADLFVPEIVEDHKTKAATVELNKHQIELAQTMVTVADADVRSAEAKLDAAKAILDQYQSQVDRWDSEVKRLTRETKRGVVDRQVTDESQNQLRSSTASRDAAKSDIVKAEADLESAQATKAKEEVNVDVAKSNLAVATSNWKRIGAWVGYLKLYAPYDGIVVARNANTGDFVLPAGGDPTADQRAPYLAPDRSAAPIYVIDRTDVVRVFVDIPEQDANYVQIGTKATVLARAFRDQPIPCAVTRTSWALNVKSRTLRAEIDLPNTESRILPGMYAYGKVIIERPNVRAIPVGALTRLGDKTYYWLHKDGRVVRTEVQTGASDGTWIEITNHQNPALAKGEDPWEPIDGTEQVVIGDLSILTDGGPVEVVPETDPTKVAESGARPEAQAARME